MKIGLLQHFGDMIGCFHPEMEGLLSTIIEQGYWKK